MSFFKNTGTSPSVKLETKQRGMSIQQQKIQYNFRPSSKNQLIKVSQEKKINAPSLPPCNYYVLNLQQQVVQGTGVLYDHIFTPLSNKQKGINVKFCSQSFVISNYAATDYPYFIWIAFDGVSGMIDQTNMGTAKVAKFERSQVNAFEREGVILYNITYKMQSQKSWLFPTNFQMKIKMYVDGSATPLSVLPGPLPLQLTITRIQ